MSIKKVTRLSVFAGVVVFTLAFSAGVSWATEPCKDKPTTTAKPKPTSTTVKAKPQAVTTTTLKSGDNASTTPTTRVAAKPVPSTTTTAEVATPAMIETTGEVNADDSIQPVQFVSATQPTELPQTGAMTTRLSLLGAALCGLGMIALWLRNRLVA